MYYVEENKKEYKTLNVRNKKDQNLNRRRIDSASTCLELYKEKSKLF